MCIRDRYNTEPYPLKNIGSMLINRIRMQGFIVSEHMERWPQALKELVASGAKLFRLPKPVMDAAYKFAMNHYSELSASNPAWKKIYTDYAAFRKDANLWFRFAEAGFDSYMQAQKL